MVQGACLSLRETGGAGPGQDCPSTLIYCYHTVCMAHNVSKVCLDSLKVQTAAYLYSPFSGTGSVGYSAPTELASPVGAVLASLASAAAHSKQRVVTQIGPPIAM